MNPSCPSCAFFFKFSLVTNEYGKKICTWRKIGLQVFSPHISPKTTPLGLRKVCGRFLRFCLDFCERKGRKKEAVRGARRRKKEIQKECKWMQLSGTISHADRERLFSPSGLCEAWAHSSIEIQYWSLPTQTMMALNRLAFTVVCFASGSKYHSTGSAQTKGSLLHPCQGSKPTWILLRDAPLDCRSYPYHVPSALMHCNQDRCCSLHPDRQEAEEKRTGQSTRADRCKHPCQRDQIVIGGFSMGNKSLRNAI